VEFQVEIKVEIGKYSILIPMFVAKINDDCLLGADFLRRIGLQNIFDREFNESGLSEKEIFNCSRIEDSPTVSSILKELFENNSVNLEIAQRKIFANFLNKSL